MSIDQIKRSLTDFIEQSQNEDELLTGLKKLVTRYEKTTASQIAERRKGMFFPDFSNHPSFTSDFNLVDNAPKKRLTKEELNQVYARTEEITWDTTLEEDLALLKSLG